MLYNVKNEYYYDKGKRGLALERIQEKMSFSEFSPLPTKENILKKMNGLRTYYNAQRSKVAITMESGTSTDSVHKVKWQFYDRLDFLRDQVTPRRTLCNINENVDGVIATQQEKRSRKGGYDPSSVLIQEATSALRSIAQKSPPPPPQPLIAKSPDVHFGETVAQLMGEISDGAGKDMLKREIQRLIYQTKYSNGQFGSNPVSPNDESQHFDRRQTYFPSPSPTSRRNFTKTL